MSASDVLFLRPPVGELRPDIVYFGSDQFGRTSTTVDAERCVAAIVLAIWYVSSRWRLRRWAIPHWTTATGIFLSLHGWTRGCISAFLSTCTLNETPKIVMTDITVKQLGGNSDYGGNVDASCQLKPNSLILVKICIHLRSATLVLLEYC